MTASKARIIRPDDDDDGRIDRHVPVIVNKGHVVTASYIAPPLAEWSGNPYIEALPPLLDDDRAAIRLTHFPPYDEDARDAPAHVRRLLIGNIGKFFVPLDIHLDLYRRIQNMIRLGYADRNPLERNHLDRRDKRMETFDQYAAQYDAGQDTSSTAAYGFNIVGISGIGKSRALLRILNTYPQVIDHSAYRDRRLTTRQLVWLKLDCPFDGNTKGICVQFFNAVDSILGTDYRKNHSGGRRIQDEMLSNMANVAADHGIGALVVDEVQRLSSARSGGAQKMLDFFTQLDSTIGVPVVKIGTYKALGVLSGEFSQARRGTGQGDLVWDRMDDGEQWRYFVDTLWRFQYTRRKCAPDDLTKDGSSLGGVLYEETQGITDLAVKLFCFAQERAIDTGGEVITAAIIRRVAADKFKMLIPALRALRFGDRRALELYEDIYPGLKKVLSVSQDRTQIEGKIASAPDVAALTDPPCDTPPDTPRLTPRKKTSRAKRDPAAGKPPPGINDSHRCSADEFLDERGGTDVNDRKGL